MEILSTDEAVSARLLEFANSTLCELGTSVSTIERASLLLGMRSLGLLSLVFSVPSQLTHAGGGGLDPRRFWQRSLVRAVAGRRLAAALGTMTDDETFLCGMLGEIGQLVLAERMGEDYRPVLERAEGEWPTRELERRLLGFDHSRITAAIFEHWGLPAFVKLAHGVATPHPEAPVVRCPEILETGHILILAEHIADLITRNHPEASLAQLEARAEEFFGLGRSHLDRLFADLHEGVLEASSVLGIDEVHVRSLDEALTNSTLPLEDEQASGGLEFVESDPRWMRAHGDPSLRDKRSGLAGQEAFDLALAAAIDGRLASPAPPPLALVLLLPDEVSDAPGDERALAERLADGVRAKDFVARLPCGAYAILPLAINGPGLTTLLDRLRSQFCGKRGGPTFCVGAGLVEGPERGGDAIELLAHTRLVLEAARAKGPNHWIRDDPGS